MIPAQPKNALAFLRNRQGLTLVETVIVLGVFSIVIAAIWLVVSVVFENVKQYNAIRNVQTTVQNARQLWTRVSQLSGTPTDYTATMDSQAAFPLDMRYAPGTAGGILNHPWSSSATGTVTVTYVDGDTFAINFTSVPKKACIGLVTRMSGGEISNLEALVINSNVWATTSMPLTIVDANGSSGCTSATANTVTWRFNIRA